MSSVSTGGSGGEDRLTENVTLNFAKVKLEYTERRGEGWQSCELRIHLGHSGEREGIASTLKSASKHGATPVW